MADPGNSSTADADKHAVRMTSWISVVIIVLACVLLGFAMVFQSVPVAVVGVLVGLAGVILAFTGKIMDEAH